MSQLPTITVFEDKVTKVEDFEEHVTNLQELSNVLDPHNVHIYVGGSMRIMHYVGFFQHGNTRLQILPKIYRNVQADVNEEDQSLAFIYRLLYWTGYLKHKPLSPQNVSATGADLLEIFISIFIKSFNEQFQRNVIRRYEERIENQQIIRGKILISETIRRNPILRLRHVIAADEYSINNHLNRVFKSVMNALLQITRQSENKKLLVIGLNYLSDVDLIPLSGEDFRRVRFTRLNRSFEPLFSMAKLFFFNQQPGLTEGSERTFSFLIPLHSLFEHFAARILDHLSTPDLRFAFHEHARWLLKDSTGQERVQLRPDYIALSGKQTIAILDAKYKSPWDTQGKVDMAESDVYQVCAYALRYGADRLLLLYPRFADTPEEGPVIGHYTITSEGGTIVLRALQVNILEENFDEIVAELRGPICDFITDGKHANDSLDRDASGLHEGNVEVHTSDESPLQENVAHPIAPEVRPLFSKLDSIIRRHVDVEGPIPHQRGYVTYKRYGRIWLYVWPTPPTIRLGFPIAKDAMDKHAVAQQLGIEVYDKSERQQKGSSANVVNINPTTDRLQIRVKEDFEVDKPQFIEFLKRMAVHGAEL